jgi:hypothetical protein
MISIRDEDKARIERIKELTATPRPLQSCERQEVYRLSSQVLENISQLMRPAKIGY